MIFNKFCLINSFKNINLKSYKNIRNFTIYKVAKNKSGNIENESKPIEYSKSLAAKWQASSSRLGGRIDHSRYPKNQDLVILASVFSVLIYFCILREENDIDEKLGKTLYDHIEGLEEQQLQLSLDYNRQHGKSTIELENRLKELRQKTN